MTKKHYTAIAEVIKPYTAYHPANLYAKPIAENLAYYFAQDNPRFNRTRFLEACGVEHIEQNRERRCIKRG